jgi:cell surface protein SprA
MSNFTFTGEYAYMSPDPNTKKSTIASDQGKSIAYIDDFEGAKRIIPVGVGYTGWKDTSPPEELPWLPGLDRQERMTYKAKSFWFTVTPSDVTVEQIYGDEKKVAREDQQVTVMDYVFMPDTPGVNNVDPELGDPSLTWGGMQKILSSTANNLIEQNVEFIEFWMKIVNAPEGASLYLDMGSISEDMIPNNILDTEDKNGNDAMEEGEDTGIDGEFDEQERITHNSTKADPSGDNFAFIQRTPQFRDDFFNINGTEGNAVLTDVGLLPDTEDLNRNGNLDKVNSYFRYKIPLDTNAATNPFRSGGGKGSDKWYLYRIPIKDTSSIVGSPSFANVESIRLFTHGSDSIIHFRITEFNLVGSQWQKLVTEDTVLSISVVSLEENPEYESPPGVFREKDRTRPDQEVFRNEQSLNLILTDLPVGESREAVKYLFRPLDVFNYKEMKLFIHGDVDTDSGSVSYVDPITGKHASEVFFRFGTDTNHYYEYRQPVVSGWNSISILFDELTAVKQAAIDTSGIITVPVPGKPGHFYRVKGNPTLTSVKFLSVGIFNLSDNGSNIPVSGEVWVNELRVVGADDSPGWAYSFSSSMKFADLLTVNFNMSERNPFFHRLSDRFGSRVESRNWAVSTNIDILKLLPFNMRESNLKINYSHTESLGKPLYIPGTDVLVEEAVKQLENAPDTVNNQQKQTPEQFITETQTLNVSNTISAANIQLKIPSEVWYINDSWNALTFGFNYNNSFSRSPTVEERFNWVWNANANYNVNFSPDLYIKLADLPIIGMIFQLLKDYKDAKIYFAPQNFAAVVSAKRNRNSNKTRPRTNVPTNEIVARDFTSSRGFNFGWRLTEGGLINLSTNYNVTISSSLAYLLEDQFGNDRTETDIWNDIIGGAGFGRDYRYQQSFDVRTSPKLPSLWDINRYFTLNAGYSVQYQWNFDLRQEVLGRSAGYSRKFTAGMVLRWKSLTEPLFTSSNDDTEPEQTGIKNDDSTGTVIKPPGKPPAFIRAL